MIENSLRPLDSQKFTEVFKIHVVKYCDVVRLGEKSNKTSFPPTPDDPAIIMYTSGSTGKFFSFKHPSYFEVAN